MKKELFAITKNGKSVWLDPQGSSHAITHFTADPTLLQQTKTALANLDATDSNVYTEIDLGQPIGYSDLVATNPDDEIVYAKRVGRQTFTRFTKSHQPVATHTITVWLIHEDSSYTLLSAWFGPKTPPFPGDKWETPESKPFWNNHALVWGKQAIIEGTETTVCPW